MNLGEILDQQENLGYADDTRTARTGMTNAVARRIYAMRRWPWLKSLAASGGTTTAGTESKDLSVAIPTLQFIDAVSIERGQSTYDLDWLANEQLRELARHNKVVGGTFITRGIPRYWTNAGLLTVHFWPVPDATYTIRVDGVTRPADMTSEATTPSLPAAYHDLLVWGPLVQMTYRERDTAGNQMAQANFNELLLEMMHQYSMVQRQTTAQVESSGEYAAYDGPGGFPWSVA